MRHKKFTSMLALGAAAALTLTACAGGGETADDTESDAGGGEDLGTITVAFTPGWSDGQSMSYLLNNQLEKVGYNVEVEEIADNGPLYAAVANGDIDIHSSAWPEVTQAAYMEEFGEDLESLGVYYDNAKLTVAVPSYSEIDSMAELADNADLFGSEIIGIEPGAGLTEVTQNSMMPAYGLEDWTLSTSSTASMLTVLGDAIENEEDVVVTLWRPFWANSEFDVKDLEDPEGAMGEAEGMHVNATAGFADENPEAAELIAGIKLDDDAYGALETLILSDEYDGDSEGAVEQWIEENPDAFPTLIS